MVALLLCGIAWLLSKEHANGAKIARAAAASLCPDMVLLSTIHNERCAFVFVVVTAHAEVGTLSAFVSFSKLFVRCLTKVFSHSQHRLSASRQVASHQNKRANKRHKTKCKTWQASKLAKFFCMPSSRVHSFLPHLFCCCLSSFPHNQSHTSLVLHFPSRLPTPLPHPYPTPK